jgi:3-hydroxyisobutyrate dehydrogenase-like beta-hydroxyacid dehydrogenase
VLLVTRSNSTGGVVEAKRRNADTLTSVSVLGLGQLGSAVASAFLAHGHPTTVWNRSAGRTGDLAADGAHVVADAPAAVRSSPLVVVVVTDYAATRDVLRSAADTLAGRLVVNLASGTPALAQEMADWVGSLGADYLDAAAMSGTRLVGDREALFLLSGSPQAFGVHQDTLEALGNAVHLGADAGLASLFDTALFGLAWSTLAGFYHAVALIGSAGVSANDAAAVATDHLPFLARLMTEHAEQISTGVYPNHDGTMDVHAAAMGHLVETGRQHGAAPDMPEFLKGLLDRAIERGYGDAGIASLTEVIRRPAAQAAAPATPR